ncbi:hypothetical protein D9M69_614280 [compost metagenome]
MAVIGAEVLGGLEALRREPPHAVQPIGLAEHAGQVERVQHVRPALVFADEAVPQVCRQAVEQRQRQMTPLVDEQHEDIGESQALQPDSQRLQLRLAGWLSEDIGYAPGPFG